MLDKLESCSGCPLYDAPYGKHRGFVPATGMGPVLLVAEAAGADEEAEGVPLVGKLGQELFRQLARIGIERDQFTIHNVLSCRPPNNQLIRMPYTAGAIAHCAPNLDATIATVRERAAQAGQHFTIVTVGDFAFKRVLGFEDRAEEVKHDHYAYPFWSDRYNAWVFNTPHPGFLVRGKTYLWPVLQFTFQRALETSTNGMQLLEHNYLLDPNPDVFHGWVQTFLQYWGNKRVDILSYDIETPYKKKTDSEDELSKDEDADHTIIRCSFAYQDPGGNIQCTSVRWSAEYMSDVELLFGCGVDLLGWNSDNYDKPRVSRHTKLVGRSLDGMVAWHVLNTNLPKALGFVTPFYVKNTLMWKHMSDSHPAMYNAKDADMALRNYLQIRLDLEKNKLWHVFDRHVLQVNTALNYMTGVGVLRDNAMRQEAETRLAGMLDGIQANMEASVPTASREFKIYKKEPKNTEGMECMEREYPVKYCAVCGLLRPTKTHAKHCPDWKVTTLPMPQKVWAKPLPFKISGKRMGSYQQALRHQAVLSREKKVTFDADAIVRLMKTYPNDPLYPLILQHREVSKLLGTYIGVTRDGVVVGGMPIGPDGRVHTTYTHNPSTLRFASEDPNLQNLPRPNPKDPDSLANIIRNLIVAAPGHLLYARDYSGIEAVLTGYFAMDAKYIRLAKQDVHTYYTVYAIHELDGRIKTADLPDLDWPDAKLFPYLAQLKKEFGKERNSLYKHLVHAANFMQGAKGAQAKIFSETQTEYPLKTVAKVMDVYYSLFPSIRRWHRAVLDEAHKEGFLRNPFGYVHRFSSVYNKVFEFGEWQKKNGPDANRVIAFKPQSTAAAVIKEAILRIFFNKFEEVGKYLRLQVHDEILFEVEKDKLDLVDKVVMEEMERPIPELRMPLSWGMGELLSINTESKVGERWGIMH